MKLRTWSLHSFAKSVRWTISFLATCAAVSSAVAARAQCLEWSDRFFRVTGIARASCVFDDGSGAALYLGGTGVLAGDTSVFDNRLSGVLRWNGSTLTKVGSIDLVRAFVIYDNGSGPALYAAAGTPVGELERDD